MNTHLCLTNNDEEKNKKIEYATYENINEIIYVLKQATTLPHDDYDSVKLYGNSEFIISVLRCILSNKKHSDILIASIDITSSTIDSTCKDDYVLILYNKELYIQSSWNKNCLYMNEAKFTICQYGVPDYILDNVLKSNTPVQICDFSIK